MTDQPTPPTEKKPRRRGPSRKRAPRRETADAQVTGGAEATATVEAPDVPTRRAAPETGEHQDASPGDREPARRAARPPRGRGRGRGQAVSPSAGAEPEAQGLDIPTAAEVQETGATGESRPVTTVDAADPRDTSALTEARNVTADDTPARAEAPDPVDPGMPISGPAAVALPAATADTGPMPTDAHPEFSRSPPAAAESTVVAAPAESPPAAAPRNDSPAANPAARDDRQRAPQPGQQSPRTPNPSQAPRPSVQPRDAGPRSLVRVPLSVRWRDLDAFNHVNNSKYLSYLEEARLRWMLAIPGMGLDEHVAPVVAASNLNYRRPISWPGDVVVELFVERIGSSSVTIGHRIVDANDGGAVYCDGNVVMVWIDRESGRAAPLPANVRTACA